MQKQTVWGVALGQLISLNLAIMTLTASFVSRQVDAPLSLSFATYLALAVFYGSIMIYRRKNLLVRWYWYALLGFIQIHGNYLVNKAMRYTSVTSVTILNCWTIAWAVLLTWFFLSTKYSTWQFVGIGICVGGLGLVLLSDVGVGGGGGSNTIFGDFLVIIGTMCFSMSNVGEEFCVKRKDRVEVLAMTGAFGMLFSGIEIAIFERKTLESVKLSPNLILGYCCYAVTAFLFNALLPIILKAYGSTLLNLSLLTTNMWVVLFRLFVYKQKLNWLYYLAFALSVVGIYIYSDTGKDDQDNELASDDVTSHGPAYTLVDVDEQAQCYSSSQNEGIH